MEISGIGGYRDGLVARSSITSASTTLGVGADGQLLEKPAATRSLGSGRGRGQGRGGDVRRQLQAGHRASEPILLDFDLPSTATTQTTTTPSSQQTKAAQRQTSQKQQKRKTMPRLNNLIPPVNLSEERRAEYKQVMEDRIERMLLRSQAAWDGTNGIFEDDPKNWKLHVSKPNLTMYRRRYGPGSDEDASTSRSFVATGRIPGLTLQDVEYGLYADTTPDERAINAYWFSDYFLDAAVLEAYETRTDDDPFLFFGTKWLLTGPFTNVKIIAPRDSAFVQYTKSVIDEYGEKILVKCVKSAPEDVIPHIPDQGDIRFVRIDFSIIYMYRFDPKSQDVQVFCEGRLDPCGRTTSWMANLNLTMYAPAVVQLNHIADVKYITKHGLMFPHDNSPTGKSDFALSVSTHLPSPMASSTADLRLSSHLAASWVPDKKRKACFVCFKGFSLLRRHRHHCRMCGEVMCSQCMVTLPLITPEKFDAEKDANFPLQNQPESKKLEDTHRHGFHVVNAFKFCKKCMFVIRQERRAMVAGVGNYYFTEGMMRHYAQMQAAFAGNYEGDQFADEAEGNETGYFDDSIDDDESIVDDVQYSNRIEKLRQEHMEREKQKLRDQSQKKQVRVSVRLFDGSDMSDAASMSVPSLGSDSNPASRKQSTSSSEVYDFDNLLVTDQKKLQMRVDAMKAAAENDDNVTDAPEEASLLSDDRRRRSFSTSNQFEKMERSIAEQEALINSIQLQRAMMKAENGDSAQSRLPIGAAMQSMALTMPAVVSSIQVEDDPDELKAATVSVSIKEQAP